jgi:hypothetical protein
MKRAIMGRKLLPRLILYSLLVFVALFVVSETAKAAVTGKIAGFVVDAETNEPLPGANVIVVGTERGAATDLDGYFFIIRLSPGTYQVQARMMGYTNVTQTGVEVISGHTIPVNFELEPTVIEGEGITIQAKREVVKMDLSSSSLSADKDDIEAVPLISDVTQFLNLQAGIDGWSIRGGSIDQTRLMADGLLLVDQRVNEPIMMPNLSEIKEISLIKGGFNAEFENVRSGVVNVVTREGSPREYQGSFDFRYTPGYQKHGGLSIFHSDNYHNKSYLTGEDSVCWLGSSRWIDTLGDFINDTIRYNTYSDWKGWIAHVGNDTTITPEQRRDLFLWRRRIDIPRTDSIFDIYSGGLAYIPIWEIDTLGDSTLVGFSRTPYELKESRRGKYGDKPDWTLDAGFGGPIPVIGEYLGNMTFYTSYRDHAETFAIPDSRDYYRERQGSLKLTSRFGDMKVSLKGTYSIINSLSPWAWGDVEGEAGNNGQVYLRDGMDIIQGTYEWGGTYHGSDKMSVGNLYRAEALSPIDVTSRMLGFTLQHTLSENTFYDIRLTYIRSNNDCKFYYDLPLRLKDTVLIWFGQEGEEEYGADNIPYGYAHPDWEDDVITDVGGAEYGAVHNLGSWNTSWSQTFNVRFDMTSQINKYNQIKGGVSFNYDNLHEFWIANDGWVWPPAGEETTYSGQQYSYTTYDESPILAGAYIQDKIEFEGMFANFGLRFDYSNANTKWPTADRYSLYFSKFLKDSLFTKGPIEDAVSHLKVSPRLGISFPILERSKLFFNYGHFYSLAPNSQRYKIYWGEYKDPVQYLGNPSLDMERTISYEVGFESSIANTYLARVTGYYKDTDNEYSEVGYTDYDEYVDYETVENTRYGDTRGFEFELRKAHGRFLTGWVNYDYRVTTSGRIGRSHYYQDPVRNQAEGLATAEQDRPLPQPVLRAQLGLKTPLDWGTFLGGYNLSFLYSWRAGWYMSWDPLNKQTYQMQNNIQWQDDRNIDMSISKNISIGGTIITLFMDVHNVLDWKTMSTQGFSNSLDQDAYLRSLHLEMYKEEPWLSEPGYTPPAEGEKPDQIGELRSDEKPYINNPDKEYLMYLNPRYFQFGIRFTF